MRKCSAPKNNETPKAATSEVSNLPVNYEKTDMTSLAIADRTINVLYGSTTYCNFYSHVKYSLLASLVRVIYVAFCCYTAPDIQPFFD